MDISSNQNTNFPRTMPESVPDIQSQPKTQVMPQGSPQGVYKMAGLDPALQNQTASRRGTGSLWSMASAAIQGVTNFINQTTVVWGSPPQPSPAPTQTQPTTTPHPKPPVVTPPPIPPAPPTPAPSLIPSWAQMFEYTGNSQWRPGTNHQKASIDLRKELFGKIEKLEILSPDGTTVIATGTYQGRDRDGRPRYKFDKAGKELPNGAILKATLKPNGDGGHGGIRYIEIPKTGKEFRF